MSKDHTEHKKSSKAIELVGSPAGLINLLITNPDHQKKATSKLINKGSEHKKVLRTLLLSRLLKLVRTIEKSSGTKFSMQKGYELVTKKDKANGKLSLALPINLSPGLDEKKVIKAIAGASSSQTLWYALNIQVLEWAAKASANKRASEVTHGNNLSTESFLTVASSQPTNGKLKKDL